MNNVIQALLDSASDVGCTEDLVVVGRKELAALEKAREEDNSALGDVLAVLARNPGRWQEFNRYSKQHGPLSTSEVLEFFSKGVQYEVVPFRPERSSCGFCGGSLRILRPAEPHCNAKVPAFFLCDCGTVGQVGVAQLFKPARWDADVIQFARLIAEMGMLGLPDGDDWEGLMTSGDLSREELDSLFERAIKRWEAAKEALR